MKIADSALKHAARIEKFCKEMRAECLKDSVQYKQSLGSALLE